MNLKIKTGTVGYNNKILISDEKFSLRKNVEVNLMAPSIKSHKYSKTNSLEPTTIESHSTTIKGLTHASNISHGVTQRPPAHRAHEDEENALVLSLAGILMIWLVHVSMSNYSFFIH